MSSASLPDLGFLSGGCGPRGAASARRPGCSRGLRWGAAGALGPAAWVGGLLCGWPAAGSWGPVLRAELGLG